MANPPVQPHQVQTEATSLAMAEEDVLGNLTPVAAGWHTIEPNSYGKFASQYKKMPRDPIVKSQQLQKGMLVDEDSGIEIELDVTKEHVDRFAKGIFRSVPKESGGTGRSSWYPTAVVASGKAFLALAGTNLNATIEAKLGGVDGDNITFQSIADGTGTGQLDESAFPAIVFHFAPTVTTEANFEAAVAASANLDVKVPSGAPANVLVTPGDVLGPTHLASGTAGSFTVDAGGALAAGRLVFARVFANPQNNGLFLVGTGSTGTSVVVDHVVTETPGGPPSNAQLDVAGVRGAAGDITMDGFGNLTSTTLDFTTLGLNDFQWIYVGNPLVAVNSFANALYFGSARIAKGGIAAHKLTLERREWTIGAADPGTGKQIDIYFTRWFRNVAMDHGDYIKYPSYVFEITYPFDSGTQYEYMLGNIVDECTWNFPLTSKATFSMKLKGTKTPNPVSSRFTGPSVAIAPSTKVGVSTAADLARLRVSNVDESGLATSFQALKIMQKNNVSPLKELGQLGARTVNVGKHTVETDGTYLFTDVSIIDAVRDNRDMSQDILMRNGDFGALLDIQSMTLDTVDRKLEKNKAIELGAKSTAHQNDISGSTDSMSVFAFLPQLIVA